MMRPVLAAADMMPYSRFLKYHLLADSGVGVMCLSLPKPALTSPLTNAFARLLFAESGCTTPPNARVGSKCAL